MAFASENDRLVVCSLDKSIKICKVSPSPAKIEMTMSGHQDSINGCVYSSNQKLLLSASCDRTMRVWDC